VHLILLTKSNHIHVHLDKVSVRVDSYISLEHKGSLDYGLCVCVDMELTINLEVGWTQDLHFPYDRRISDIMISHGCWIREENISRQLLIYEYRILISI
jgi:hypothetical protein